MFLKVAADDYFAACKMSAIVIPAVTAFELEAVSIPALITQACLHSWYSSSSRSAVFILPIYNAQNYNALA